MLSFHSTRDDTKTNRRATLHETEREREREIRYRK